MTLALSGHGVVDGIAVGQVHIIRRNELNIGEYRIEAAAADAEVQRLRKALATASEHLEQLAQRIRQSAGEAAEDIIRTHIAMLADRSLADTANAHIREQLCNAEWALQLYLEAFLERLDSMNDPYIRSRGEDLAQVVQLVQEILSEEPAPPLTDLPDRLGETLVIAAELTPGELAILHERGVAGLITEHGSPHSHTAILARSLGIPTVMAVHHGRSLIREGEQLILDGHYGIVFASPEESILKHYLQKQAHSDRFLRSLESVRELPCRSLDGVDVCLRANAERSDDLALGLASGAEGVGLYRTEFLFLQGRAPDEDTQYAEYRKAVEACSGHDLTIRTLDLGADKGADLLDFQGLRSRPNPALGLRAVRLLLREMDLFRAQLKAILRASAHGPVQCLIPMLTSAGEVRAVRALLADARRELDAAGQAYDPDMPLGGMIEVPAAALALKALSRDLDFLSIGTNDLIQYALATDRVDEQVAHLYDPQHPGVVQLLLHIFQLADELDIPVAVCGELAGDRRYTRLLLALGLTEFSMQPRSLLEVKQVITVTDVARARAALHEWLKDEGGADGPSLLHHVDQSQVHPAATTQ